MRTFPLSLLFVALTSGALTAQATSLETAADALKVSSTKSLEISATGSWFQFGQAPAPSLPWPRFDVSRYQASINFDNSVARVQIVRKQALETGRNRPAPVEQKVDQYINGKTAWNLNTGANGTATPTSQPVAVEERSAEIISTPQGFVKAALANHAQQKNIADGVEVSFTLGGKYHYLGKINSDNEVEHIKTWIDTPVLGDTLYETHFSNYKDFQGVKFPQHLVRNEGGAPILDLQVSSVTVNPSVDLPVPQAVADAKPVAVKVVSTQLADGVFYLTGGSHHSVLIEQQDHLVLVEAPLNEERSVALLQFIKENFPKKSVKYLINTHAHFDHSGGLRTFVDAGVVIVTEKTNAAYYQKIWANPHNLNPDRLSHSKKSANLKTFDDHLVLADKKHKIEIHRIQGNSHNDAFDLIYLPAEKILIEADAYTALAAGATPPATVNPYSVNLYENIQRLGLQVDQIAGIHGPGVVKLADLKTYIGLSN